MFIDKIFAIEFYYIRNMYKDVSKHLYDISILYQNDTINKLLKNKNEIEKLILYKRQEEKIRIGGIDANTKIKNFNYFKLDFNDELINEFNNMQYKYVLNDKYKVTIDYAKDVISEIYTYIKNI